MSIFLDFLGNLSGYRLKYLDAIDDLSLCRASLEEQEALCDVRIVELEEAFRNLNLKPPPHIESEIKDSEWVYKQLVNIPLCGLQINPPVDPFYTITDEANFQKMVDYLDIDLRKYVVTFFDCDEYYEVGPGLINWFFQKNNLAMVIDYSSSHAYCIASLIDGPKIVEFQLGKLYDVKNRNMTHYGMQKTEPDNGWIQI